MVVSLTMSEPTTACRPARTSLMPACSASPGSILRTFERLRRELSVEVCGDEGMFPGYDTMVFSRNDYDRRGLVLLSAELTEDFGKTHSVEFVASVYVAVAPGESPPDSLTEVARGRGRTLRLNSSR